MAPRTAAIIVLTTAICLGAPKERAWQDGRLLDNRNNPYFNKKDIDGDASPGLQGGQLYNDSTVYQNSGSVKVAYDHFVIEGRSSVYLVEQGRVMNYPAAHVAILRALKFAVEKNKLWFVDQDGKEVETKVLKQVARPGATMVTEERTPAPSAPAPVPTPVAVAVAAVPQPAPTVVETPKMQEALVATTQAPPHEEKAAVTPKPSKKTEPPAAKPALPQVAVAASKDPGGALKDRPWQSGQLLSTASNPFFANVAYTTDTEASSWTFVQGADGRATAFIRAGTTSNNSYIYDNYVIETEFLSYLVQRPRLKTVAPVRFPGSRPLKFAIEKTKIWIMDEEGKEYEAKIVKQVQKNPDPAGAAGMRTAAR